MPSKPAKKAQALAQDRNRTGEAIAASQSLASRLVQLRDQRMTQEWKDLIYVSRYLVAMSFPYQPTKERQITKTARFGDGTRVHLTLSAAIDGINLPYGSDRTLLHWLLDQITRQVREAEGDPDAIEKARFVPLNRASDYLKEMGLDAQGGKNYRDLRGRYRRLAGLNVGLRIEGPNRETIANIPLIELARIPTAKDLEAERQGLQSLGMEGEELSFGVLFSRKLVATLMDSAVPFPREILRKTRKQSQMQDYWLFMAWRSFGAKKETTIPWDDLREQLWQQDQNTRRIKGLFKQAIAGLRLIWPELRAEVREEGLWIAPPRGKVQLLDRGSDLKRLEAED